MARSFFSRVFTRAFQFLNWFIPWHKLPRILGILSLMGLRIILRERNLHDTSKVASPTRPPLGKLDPRHLISRTADGSCNDLKHPAMGSAKTRFGRNVPLEHTYPDQGPAFLTPSPRTVSLELLTRHTFQPATTLNLLAAAWIQFMVHDWFSHGKNETENPLEIPLEENDPWPERPMRIRRTRNDPTRSPVSPDRAPTYLNTETHWWDASQLYGSNTEIQAKVRSGKDGKLILGKDGLLPLDPATGTDFSGVTGNWWVGLSMLHHLFTYEHNAICDRLRSAYPIWGDEELFAHARLINAALLAKIHTLEWTPGILAHPTVQAGMYGNWWGFATEGIYKTFGRLSESEIVSGIPGSPADHYTAPFSMTEEFVSVYRMHPLMPDEFRFRALSSNRLLQERTLPHVSGKHARSLMKEVSLTDLFYSFGISHPGAITLHNYPRFLQRLERPVGPLIDLAAVDVLRDRERGVPRYNQFRKLLHLPRIRSFEALTKNKTWVEELRRVYDNDIDRVDVMVGMFAEQPPKGFGFSDTAFRIFILMASRRLKSDRFFTDDYTPQVYTQKGFDWIHENTMQTVLLRHFPDLGRALHRVKNAFAPWPRTVPS